MKYTIKEGWITITGKAAQRPFVARVIGISDKWGLERTFVSTSEVKDAAGTVSGLWRARFEIGTTRFIELGGWERSGSDPKARIYGEVKGSDFVPVTLEAVKATFGPVIEEGSEYDDALPF
ncbi:MAG: hypothetical protein WCI20_09775 [bacterium]